MMAAVCPDVHTWEALLWNDAPADPEGWQQHLETCPHCQQTLQDLAAEDSAWTSAARHLKKDSHATPLPGSLASAREPALARVMERLKRAEPVGGMGEEDLGGKGTREAEPDVSFLRPADRPELLGHLGSYEILEVLGRGGMGIVLKAFDPALQRTVAIKVLAPRLAGSTTARKRFLREARAAAAVTHDHVIPIYEVGEADGLPYLVMPCLTGLSFQEKVDRTGPRPVLEVVRIGMQTASGLAAAHARGLIHRDVKPANILLEEGTDRVKITDFGLARAADDASLTREGMVSGTPAYMAPEQARGEPLDARADLFSLGSVLFFLGTGKAPFEGDSTLAILRRVGEEQPRPMRELNPEIPGWLEEIVGRLRAREPQNRFASAAEVAELLQRHLAHLQEPTRVPPPPHRNAGPRPPRSSLSRRRLVLAVVLLAAGTLGMCEAAGWTHLAQFAAATLHLPNGRDSTAAQAAQATKPENLTAPKEPAAAGPRTPRADNGVLLQTARDLWLGHEDAIASGTFTPDGKTVVTGGWDGTVKVWTVATGKDRLTIKGFARGLRALAVSPDGKTLATATFDRAIRLWDLKTGQPGVVLTGHVGPVMGLAFSPDGKTLASAGGPYGKGGELKLWDLETAKERFLISPFNRELWGVAYAPDGKSVAVAVGDGTAQTVDPTTGKIQDTFKHASYARKVAFSPDGKRLAVAFGEEGYVALWDLKTGQEQGKFQAHTLALHSLSFSPDGKRLLTSSGDGGVVVWDVTRPQVRAAFTLDSKQGKVFFAAFSPNGKLVATGGSDTTVRLWDLGQE